MEGSRGVGLGDLVMPTLPDALTTPVDTKEIS